MGAQGEDGYLLAKKRGGRGGRERKTDRQTNFVPNIRFQKCGEVSFKSSSMERLLSALAGNVAAKVKRI